VELCLTVPVRLSSLLPYLPMLMDPLVSALNGSQTLISQVSHHLFLSSPPPLLSFDGHFSRQTPRVGAGAPPFPPFPIVFSLPIFYCFLIFPFSFSYSIYLFPYFVHPFPFYQNSPTPFPGRRL